MPYRAVLACLGSAKVVNTLESRMQRLKHEIRCYVAEATAVMTDHAPDVHAPFRDTSVAVKSFPAVQKR